MKINIAILSSLISLNVLAYPVLEVAPNMVNTVVYPLTRIQPLNLTIPVVTLFEAVIREDVTAVREILAAETYDLNSASDSEDYILLTAMQTGNAHIVRLLLRAGANANIIDCIGQTPLTIAAKKKQREIIVLLLNYGAHIDMCDSQGKTALMHATNMRTVKLLLRLGANPNAVIGEDSALARALDDWDTAKVLLLLQHGATPVEGGILNQAINAGVSDGLFFSLLKGGADPNVQDPANGETALHRALKTHRFLIAGLLIPLTDLSLMDSFGDTPKQIAQRSLYPDMHFFPGSST